MRVLLVLPLVAMVNTSSASAAPVVFADETFDNANWTIVDHQVGGGGSSSGGKVLVDGDPGEYRSVTTSINASSGERRVFSFNLLDTGAVYDPSVEGEIVRIDYSESAIIFAVAQTVALCLQQGDSLYSHPLVGTFTGQSWTELQATGLVAEDFKFADATAPQGFDETVHPDFSATGSPITFGFLRGLGASGGSALTSRGGIDNWRVTINPDPVPVSEQTWSLMKIRYRE